MQTSRTTLPPYPAAAAWEESEELIWAAMALAELGDSSEVQPRVTEALSGLPTLSHQARANALFAGAHAQVDDPAAAAAGGLAALDANAAWPSASVVGRVRRLSVALPSGPGAPAEVVKLRRALSTAPPHVADNAAV
ncbi:hypothetical protein [Frankia sp. CgS1]|nr:hypothetical protein [Frankia sp. CgIS1]